MIYLLLLAFGIFTLGYGIYMVKVRIITPKRLGKLDALQRDYGLKFGYLIHFVFYSLLPIITGCVMIMLGVIMLL